MSLAIIGNSLVHELSRTWKIIEVTWQTVICCDTPSGLTVCWGRWAFLGPIWVSGLGRVVPKNENFFTSPDAILLTCIYYLLWCIPRDFLFFIFIWSSIPRDLSLTIRYGRALVLRVTCPPTNLHCFLKAENFYYGRNPWIPWYN